jgi:hypothetical protein
VLLCHHQKRGHNQGIKAANRLSSNLAQFKFLGMTITNQNLICVEIKSRLDLGNACYCSVQNLLSSCLLSKNIKIITYKTIIFFLFCMDVKLYL